MEYKLHQRTGHDTLPLYYIADPPGLLFLMWSGSSPFTLQQSAKGVSRTSTKLGTSRDHTSFGTDLRQQRHVNNDNPDPDYPSPRGILQTRVDRLRQDGFLESDLQTNNTSVTTRPCAASWTTPSQRASPGHSAPCGPKIKDLSKQQRPDWTTPTRRTTHTTWTPPPPPPQGASVLKGGRM